MSDYDIRILCGIGLIKSVEICASNWMCCGVGDCEDLVE